MTTAQVLTILAGVVALIGAYFYFFGIDPETKRELERKALKTMGENKMSYMAKDQINKIPTSDQEDVKQLKKGLGNAFGGVTNNPLGEQAVRAATQVWDTATNISTDAIERVSTMAANSKNEVQESVDEKTK